MKIVEWAVMGALFFFGAWYIVQLMIEDISIIRGM